MLGEIEPVRIALRLCDVGGLGDGGDPRKLDPRRRRGGRSGEHRERGDKDRDARGQGAHGRISLEHVRTTDVSRRPAMTRAPALGADEGHVGRLALADRALEPAEAAIVRAAPPEDRAAVFHRAWARREAVVKCTGAGLGGPPAPGPLSVLDLDVGEGYAAAVAIAGDSPARVELVERP